MNGYRKFSIVVPHAGIARKIKDEHEGGWGDYEEAIWIVHITYIVEKGSSATLTVELTEAAPNSAQQRIDLKALLFGAEEIPI